MTYGHSTLGYKSMQELLEYNLFQSFFTKDGFNEEHHRISW